VKFEIDPFRKHCLINGLDDIGLTMEKKSSIDTTRQRPRRGAAPGPDWSILLTEGDACA
jgi:3-isopropylmalate/(R)-2-methylmalate dehydratase small subunit